MSRITPMQFGARCDSFGTPGSGADDTAALQAAIEAAEAQGGTLVLPGRPTMCRTTAPLLIRRHLVIAGDYCQPTTVNDGRGGSPGAGSWLYFDHAGVGLRQGGAGTQVTGVLLEAFCTLRNQPAPLVGRPWSPAPNDFDIVEEQDDLTIRNLLLLNPTKGVSASGRITIDGLRGQPMRVGLSVERALDVPRVSNVHWWPFWSNARSVVLDTKNNAEAFRWGRADNPFFTNSFAIFVKTCVHLVQTPAGVTHKMHAVNIDCDLVGGDGWLVEAPGATGQMSNVTTQGAGPMVAGNERLTTADHAFHIAAANTSFTVSGLSATGFGSSAVLTEGGGGSTLLIEGLRVDGWGVTSPTAPAVSAGAGDTVTLGAGAVITGAPSAAPIYGGAGLVSAVATRRVN